MARYRDDDRGNDRQQSQGNGNKGNGKEPWLKIGPWWSGSGYISVAVWMHDGKNGPSFSLKLQKRFKDDKGDYQDSESFFPVDLPIVTLALQQAHVAILNEQMRK